MIVAKWSAMFVPTCAAVGFGMKSCVSTWLRCYPSSTRTDQNSAQVKSTGGHVTLVRYPLGTVAPMLPCEIQRAHYSANDWKIQVSLETVVVCLLWIETARKKRRSVKLSQPTAARKRLQGREAWSPSDLTTRRS